MAALREDKSPGPDDFSARLLKMTCEEIAHPIALIFNRSMKAGDVSLDWKTAHIMSIFKKGNRSSPENYRPVSLTSQQNCLKLWNQFSETKLSDTSTNTIWSETLSMALDEVDPVLQIFLNFLTGSLKKSMKRITWT